jgi:hypothetical protein
MTDVSGASFVIAIDGKMPILRGRDTHTCRQRCLEPGQGAAWPCDARTVA